MEALPEDCLSLVISLTSPCDACSSAAVSAAFRGAADSDVVWESFLPPDYRDIISRSVSPVELSSKKDAFRRLSSTPLLIDGGKKIFSIDKNTNKKRYMLSARELSIAWSKNSLYWSWKPVQHSRFSEAAELVMVSWLELHAKVKMGTLSPNTTYAAYLILQLVNRAFGLDVVASEASIEIGNYKTKRTIYVDKYKIQGLNELKEGENSVIRPRGDGWLEVELGEFHSNGRKEEEEVNIWFRETKGVHLKGGIVVEGIELRPKT
ncbi:F-box protein PP2-B15-like [Salvia miltiorrhiza]|uniref:F-box protein PP2-B15-like n=1 Tax=Salvia miltiorrhiza TaxID=226208 RepID=UPI0025AB897A|nr:F-box protein PP2-B15-like [Salvia miltiorrhiza]